jgi:hypothetical protein
MAFATISGHRQNRLGLFAGERADHELRAGSPGAPRARRRHRGQVEDRRDSGSSGIRSPWRNDPPTTTMCLAHRSSGSFTNRNQGLARRSKRRSRAHRCRPPCGRPRAAEKRPHVTSKPRSANAVATTFIRGRVRLACLTTTYAGVLRGRETSVATHCRFVVTLVAVHPTRIVQGTVTVKTLQRIAISRPSRGRALTEASSRCRRAAPLAARSASATSPRRVWRGSI